MKNGLLGKYLAFSYGSLVTLLLSLLSTMITTRLLSPADFGRATMFTVVINVMAVFVIFGTDQSFGRFFYEEEQSQRSGLLYSSLIVPMVLGFLAVLTTIFFYRPITLYAFGQHDFGMALLMCIGVVAQMLYRFGTVVIRMQQKGKLFSNLGIASSIISLISFLCVYLIIGNTYKVVVVSSVATTVVMAILSIIVERHFWSVGNLKFSFQLKNSRLDIIKYAYPLVLTTLITWLFQVIDKLAVKHWSNFHELGLYAAAFKIAALLNVVQASFTTFWTPVSYERYEKNPTDIRFFEVVSKTVAFLMFTVAVVSIMAKGVIILILGDQYKAAADIMPFLVFMPVLYTMSETTVIGINFNKKPKWHILIAGTSCLVNVVGCWILVPEYGAIGAAVVSAVSYVWFFILRTHISLRFFSVNYGLKKLYFMMGMTFLYALGTVAIHEYLINVLLGLCVLMFLLVVYYKDLHEALSRLRGAR